MPRNYKRKNPERKVCTQEKFDAAKELVEKGRSMRSAAIEVGMSLSTLRTRLLQGAVAEKFGRAFTFTKEQEMDIYNSLKKCDKLCHGLTSRTFRKLVYEYAECNNIPHRFSKSSKMAGTDWVAGFLKRHPDLKMKKLGQPEVTIERKLNRSHVSSFFDNLEALCNKFNFEPSHIYNVSEIGIDFVSDKTPKVISLKGRNFSTTNAERGQTITLVCAVNAIGSFLPPVFIFPTKLKPDQIEDIPDECIIFTSELGFINVHLFTKYLEHFNDQVKGSKRNRILLIFDNHSSHISVGAVMFCKNNGIHLLIIPPNSNHKMQPIDLGMFEAFQRKFVKTCNKWLLKNSGAKIQPKTIPSLAIDAMKLAATSDYVSYGFKATGIWPIDREIFKEEDFRNDAPNSASPARSLLSTDDSSNDAEEKEEEEDEEEEVYITIIDDDSIDIQYDESPKASTSHDPLAKHIRRKPLSAIQSPPSKGPTKLEDDGDEARLKWKYIRDQARKECRKQDSEWDLLPRLQFLINQFNDYEGTENETFGHDSFPPDLTDDHDADQEPFYMDPAPVKDDEFDEFDTKPIIMETDFYDDEDEPNKSASNNEQINEQKDEDVGFFNSLLPHIRKLGPAKKLMLRMKIQELVYNTVYSET